MVRSPPRSLEVPHSLWRDDSQRKFQAKFGGALGRAIHSFATSFQDTDKWKAGHVSVFYRHIYVNTSWTLSLSFILIFYSATNTRNHTNTF
jgi:hypothetical protein